MNLNYTIFLNGGNSYLEKVKEKIKKLDSQRVLILQQIYTLWDNISNKAEEIYLK